MTLAKVKPLILEAGSFKVYIGSMPSRNVIKKFYNGGTYHAYNRGVEKRTVFIDDQDYRMFIYYLRLYLTPDLEGFELRQWNHRDLSRSIDLISYCLMPNHYHLILRQLKEGAITELMRRVVNGYTQYFNRRWGRIGTLFQGSYKAASVVSNEQLMHLSKYIHINPLAIGLNISSYPYSSYKAYLGEDSHSWLRIGSVLELFGGFEQYKIFMNDEAIKSSHILSDISIEDFKGSTLAKVEPLKRQV